MYETARDSDGHGRTPLLPPGERRSPARRSSASTAARSMASHPARTSPCTRSVDLAVASSRTPPRPSAVASKMAWTCSTSRSLAGPTRTASRWSWPSSMLMPQGIRSCLGRQRGSRGGHGQPREPVAHKRRGLHPRALFRIDPHPDRSDRNLHRHRRIHHARGGPAPVVLALAARTTTSSAPRQHRQARSPARSSPVSGASMDRCPVGECTVGPRCRNDGPDSHQRHSRDTELSSLRDLAFRCHHHREPVRVQC